MCDDDRIPTREEHEKSEADDWVTEEREKGAFYGNPDAFHVAVLDQIARVLEDAEREGTAEDVPEGTCYITMSDTLAKRISQDIRSIICVLEIKS